MEDDPEFEFWNQGSASQEALFLSLDPDEAVASHNAQAVAQSSQHVGSSGRVQSPQSSHGAIDRHALSEQTDSRSSRAGLSATAKGKRPEFAREISTSTSSDGGGYTADSGSDDDDDDSMVEALLDTESDSSSSLPQSKEASFLFSQGRSQNSSMTSLSSSASYDRTTGRKRTLPFEDTWSPIASTAAANKAPKLSKDNARPVPGTPSRSSVASPARLRAIHDAIASSTPTTPQKPERFAQPDSPTPYRNQVSTPVIAQLGRSLVQSMGLGSEAPEGMQIIAHSSSAQALMDELFIPWGVQYELARGVSRGWLSWSDVTRVRLDGLRGNNRDCAAKVSQVFPRLSTAGGLQPDLQLWTELDREELAICEGRLRGLGLHGEWEGTEDWYGGKIQQVARLEEEHGEFRLVLAPMEMRKSNRFARFLGSRRILQVSIPREMRNTRGDDLRKYFTRKFVLCGRVFVAFGAKDGKVFLMETNEDYERAARTPGDNQRMSLEEFVAWHNPMDKNGKQAVSKWATRFDLGLSISVPALAFDLDKMFNINDEFVPGTTGKRSAEHIYTDGCGFMSGAALSEIGRRMGYATRPTAVQGRIAGAKGLWMLHPRDRDPAGTPKIWVRESQRKINLDFNNLHPAHRIFDLLAPPRVTLPSRLSRLTILNLAHNGVPTDVFVELMKETLDEQVRALTQWTRPQDMQLLWACVNRIGHVSAARIQQYALGASRALGLSGRIREDEFPSDEPSDPIEDLLDAAAEDVLLGDDESATLLAELEQAGAIAQSLRDKFTGEPLTLHGVVLDLLQAGFNPLRLPLLYEKLKIIISKVIEDVIREFHVSVPLSAEAFIVPDPYGVLEEGEIHFKSTKDLKPPLEDLQPNILLGDVLIYRNPNRLPSDVQKVRAVQHESLADYVDVIVLPTKGPCSFASMLAGGDYDGDVCVCIYDPRLVHTFKNSPLSQPPAGFLKDNFEDQGKIEQVTEVAAQMARMTNSPDARRMKLQHALLSDVSLPPVGAYSVFHENAAYVHGYDAPQTVRIAFMFNTILDSRKTGLRVKDQVFRADKRQYDKQRPECLSTSANADSELARNVALRRPNQLGRFVLDVLLDEGKKLRDTHLADYEKVKKSPAFSETSDQDLLRPYHNVLRLMDHPSLMHDLALIRTHVEDHIKRWQALTRESKPNPQTPSRSSRAKRHTGGPSNMVDRRNRWKELAQSFASGPNIDPDSTLALVGDVDVIKASWAYAVKPNFAWRMAFQSLCRIKAITQGSVAMTGRFADSMSISASAVRVLEQSRLGMS
ncbi:hypothetical protein OH77DRAFT_1428830 [Trametes cingulata]|nr:hypothetical protein OH77DRAFT_1428830 [Trametes cingulata]